MKAAAVIGATLLCLCVQNVHSTDADKTDFNEAISLDLVARYNEEQIQEQRQIDLAVAPITSKAELAEHLHSTPRGASPLDVLSPGAKRRFLASLRFGEHGLASYAYDDLEAECTSAQIYRILSLFGVQSGTYLLDGARRSEASDGAFGKLILRSPDNKDAACNGQHTCYHSPTDICTSNC
ncbi:MAG TPA: hypothetical protein VFB32_01345 [Rudaea sp.]|nr:hypothetical protein [Rudaea sp.]